MEKKDIILLVVVAINTIALIVRFFNDKNFYEKFLNNYLEASSKTKKRRGRKRGRKPTKKTEEVKGKKTVTSPGRKRHHKYDCGEYILHKDGEKLAEGTINEIAREMGIKNKTVVHYIMPSYYKKTDGKYYRRLVKK